jgi:hypothetical protein
VQGHHTLFCKCLDNPGCLTQAVVMVDNVDTERDDSCPGLVETLAREAE